MPDLFDIDAGDMRRRITIQQNTPTRDAKGQPIESWSTVNTRWASITPASGSKFVASEQIRNQVSHKIVMRYYAGLTPRNRILYGTRVFNILSVINESEMNTRHTVLVAEVV